MAAPTRSPGSAPPRRGRSSDRSSAARSVRSGKQGAAVHRRRKDARPRITPESRNRYLVIGAGPAGLAAARNLQRLGIPFEGFELHDDVGGLWDIRNPQSTMYESAHLISSKSMTEFAEYPMADHVADYPSHRELKDYFTNYARDFGLYESFRFRTRVERVEPAEADDADALTPLDPQNPEPDGYGWRVTVTNLDTKKREAGVYRGVICANGTLSEPRIPELPGQKQFKGELFHSARYKSPDVFAGKRVLIVGAGNSGCDIAVDAVHRAKSVHLSVRRGYHFVPKYVFGKPADTVGGLFKLPAWLKQKIDGFLLGWFTLDPTKYGFPEPDHKLYESHPIVNSLVLHHLGHGDIDIRPDVKGFSGRKVLFSDGGEEEYDLVLLATGYHLHYPFLDDQLLNLDGETPRLYLNALHPRYDHLFIAGMVEAAGIGWQGRFEQAELIARFIAAKHAGSSAANDLRKRKAGPPPDLSGGFRYDSSPRMSYYVNKDAFLRAVRKENRRLSVTVPSRI